MFSVESLFYFNFKPILKKNKTINLIVGITSCALVTRLLIYNASQGIEAFEGWVHQSFSGASEWFAYYSLMLIFLVRIDVLYFKEF